MQVIILEAVQSEVGQRGILVTSQIHFFRQTSVRTGMHHENVVGIMQAVCKFRKNCGVTAPVRKVVNSSQFFIGRKLLARKAFSSALPNSQLKGFTQGRPGPADFADGNVQYCEHRAGLSAEGSTQSPQTRVVRRATDVRADARQYDQASARSSVQTVHTGLKRVETLPSARNRPSRARLSRGAEGGYLETGIAIQELSGNHSSVRQRCRPMSTRD